MESVPTVTLKEFNVALVSVMDKSNVEFAGTPITLIVPSKLSVALTSAPKFVLIKPVNAVPIAIALFPPTKSV